MSTASKTSPTPQRLSPPPISWRVWPLLEGGGQSWGLVVLIVVLSVVVALRLESLAWGLTAATLLCAACWRFFVPTQYELSALGATQIVLERRRRVPWHVIDRCEIGRRGVYLTSADAPLEALRGLYLPWGKHRDEVLANVAYYLAHRDGAVSTASAVAGKTAKS